MAACISNNSNKPKDPASGAIPRSRCSLQRLASFLLKGHPALPVLVGNSGNMADVGPVAASSRVSVPANHHLPGQVRVLSSQ